MASGRGGAAKIKTNGNQNQKTNMIKKPVYFLSASAGLFLALVGCASMSSADIKTPTQTPQTPNGGSARSDACTSAACNSGAYYKFSRFWNNGPGYSVNAGTYQIRLYDENNTLIPADKFFVVVQRGTTTPLICACESSANNDGKNFNAPVTDPRYYFIACFTVPNYPANNKKVYMVVQH